MLPKTVLLYGKDEPLPERIELHAGPLSMFYENGDLRYIKLGDQEIIRRVYMAVRDRNWGTIPPKFMDVLMDIGANTFRITYRVENKQDEIDFAWHGEISGDSNGTLQYKMDGIARSTFWRNRIGFCVLHPAFLAGRRFIVEHVDGSQEETYLPTAISADQPVMPFSEMQAMTHEVTPGIWAEARYTGDIFEIEDQRNWTDASFKTFCTPLRLPYPVNVPEGTKISQSVTLTIIDKRGIPAAGEAAMASIQPLMFTVAPLAEALPLPPIGLETASHGQLLSGLELERLAALNLGHLRVELELSEPDFPEKLSRAWNDAKSLEIPLEAALLISSEGDEELRRLRQALDEIQPDILRWLVYPSKELFWGGSPTAQVIAFAHTHLDTFSQKAQFCSGTNTDLIFVQRNMPPLDQIDALTIAIIAETHASDAASIVETLEAQPMVVRTAIDLAKGKPVIVSPVSLKMRHNPYATGPWPVIKPGEPPPMVDERQMSLFAAAWTMGSLKRLAESGAHSLTYFETSGWRGVMELPGGSPLPDKFRSLPGSVFPMYHIFADVGEFAGGQVISTRISDNLRLEGIALRKNGRTRVILANLTAEPQNVTVTNLSPQVACFRLDETNVEEAMTSPEGFRRAAGDTLLPLAGSLELSLLPYGIVRLDDNQP